MNYLEVTDSLFDKNDLDTIIAIIENLDKVDIAVFKCSHKHKNTDTLNRKIDNGDLFIYQEIKKNKYLVSGVVCGKLEFSVDKKPTDVVVVNCLDFQESVSHVILCSSKVLLKILPSKVPIKYSTERITDNFINNNKDVIFDCVTCSTVSVINSVNKLKTRRLSVLDLDKLNNFNWLDVNSIEKITILSIDDRLSKLLQSWLGRKKINLVLTGPFWQISSVHPLITEITWSTLDLITDKAKYFPNLKKLTLFSNGQQVLKLSSLPNSVEKLVIKCKNKAKTPEPTYNLKQILTAKKDELVVEDDKYKLKVICDRKIKSLEIIHKETNIEDFISNYRFEIKEIPDRLVINDIRFELVE